MLNIVFYFQVHQPYRLAHLNLLNLGSDREYFDKTLNRKMIAKVAERCYLPANALILKLIRRYGKQFKVSYSITGTAFEQLQEFAPAVIDSFRELLDTGCVELLGETYYHSLASLYDTDEFLDQVQLHRDLLSREFGVTPCVFRNTELIYQDMISSLIYEIEGYKMILTEGVDRILQWRSPLYAYRNYAKEIFLLLKHYKLSDDIAFRFSDSKWKEYPLTPEKYVNWIIQYTLAENQGRNQFLNLFLDYETFGEHQWAESGIFDFLEHLPEAVLSHPNLGFCHPSDAIHLANYQPESISFPEPVSWADISRDLSAWTDNDMQKNALNTLYNLLRRAKRNGRSDLVRVLRLLSTSDHFYYMSTKYFSDGDVHKYFSPYDSPEQAYIYFTNALADVEERF